MLLPCVIWWPALAVHSGSTLGEVDDGKGVGAAVGRKTGAVDRVGAIEYVGGALRHVPHVSRHDSFEYDPSHPTLWLPHRFAVFDATHAHPFAGAPLTYQSSSSAQKAVGGPDDGTSVGAADGRSHMSEAPPRLK